MEPGIYRNDFANAFSKLLEKAGKSCTCYKIGEYTDLTQGCLSRLRSGERRDPKLGTIFKISLALVHFSDKITLHDVEQLFNSVGRSINVKEE